MARISKPPEIRKQELVEIAIKLFVEKGYEAVSVRDILKEVNGHPGMFYYYFQSKQEIYNEAMYQMIQKQLAERTKIICDKSRPVLERARHFLSVITNGINEYYKTFTSPESIAYQTQVVFDLLKAMSEPVSHFMLEAAEQGYIPPEVGLNESNALTMALFLIHGCFGVTHGGDTSNDIESTKNLIPFVSRFLHVPAELLVNQ